MNEPLSVKKKILFAFIVVLVIAVIQIIRSLL
jgi:hypothetical protein